MPVRQRIFELDPNQLDTYIADSKPAGPTGSVYHVAVLPPELSEHLILAARTDLGILVDRTKQQVFWTAGADAWSYSKADATLRHGGRSGGGTGETAVRPAKDGCETHIDYTVYQDVGSALVIDSAIEYNGVVPPKQSVVFFAPLVIPKTGERSVQVIVFSFGEARSTVN